MLKNKRDDWDKDFTSEDYIVYSLYGDPDNKPIGLNFLCPGCGSLIGIDIGPVPPKWSINFETLTATPSILHSKDGKGCGWHGYLTNGELKS